MPNVDELSPENRKRLLGCIKGKNDAWREKHKKDDIPQEVRDRHFTECSKELGLE